MSAATYPDIFDELKAHVKNYTPEIKNIINKERGKILREFNLIIKKIENTINLE